MIVGHAQFAQPLPERGGLPDAFADARPQKLPRPEIDELRFEAVIVRGRLRRRCAGKVGAEPPHGFGVEKQVVADRF